MWLFLGTSVTRLFGLKLPFDDLPVLVQESSKPLLTIQLLDYPTQNPQYLGYHIGSLSLWVGVEGIFSELFVAGGVSSSGAQLNAGVSWRM